MITYKQVVKASKQKRRNGFYLVYRDGVVIGSITKPYHTKEFRVGPDETYQTFSTFRGALKSFQSIKETFKTSEVLSHYHQI